MIGWQEEPKPFQCNISQNIYYQLYATVGAFYLPLMVMVVIYYRIYKVSYRISQAEAKSQPTNHPSAVQSAPACSLHKRSVQEHFQLKPLLKLKRQRQEENKKGPRAMRCLDGSGDSAGLSWRRKASNRLQKIKLLKGFYTTSSPSKTNNNNNSESDLCGDQNKQQNINQTSNPILAVPGLEAPTSKYNFLQPPRPSSARPSRQFGQQLLPQHSSHLARENKATITLGVIMGTFIACWLPFFILALIKPFCSHHSEGCIPHWLGALFLWLGFANSFLNPIIYARFNREFRKPFKEILLCKCRGINRRLRTETYAEQYGPPSLDRLMITAGGAGHSHHSSETHLNNSQSRLPHKQPLTSTAKKSAVVLYENDQAKTVARLDNSTTQIQIKVNNGNNKSPSDNQNKDESEACRSDSLQAIKKFSFQTNKQENYYSNYNSKVDKKDKMVLADIGLKDSRKNNIGDEVKVTTQLADSNCNNSNDHSTFQGVKDNNGLSQVDSVTKTITSNEEPSNEVELTLKKLHEQEDGSYNNEPICNEMIDDNDNSSNKATLRGNETFEGACEVHGNNSPDNEIPENNKHSEKYNDVLNSKSENEKYTGSDDNKTGASEDSHYPNGRNQDNGNTSGNKNAGGVRKNDNVCVDDIESHSIRNRDKVDLVTKNIVLINKSISCSNNINKDNIKDDKKESKNSNIAFSNMKNNYKIINDSSSSHTLGEFKSPLDSRNDLGKYGREKKDAKHESDGV